MMMALDSTYDMLQQTCLDINTAPASCEIQDHIKGISRYSDDQQQHAHQPHTHHEPDEFVTVSRRQQSAAAQNTHDALRGPAQ